MIFEKFSNPPANCPPYNLTHYITTPLHLMIFRKNSDTSLIDPHTIQHMRVLLLINGQILSICPYMGIMFLAIYCPFVANQIYHGFVKSHVGYCSLVLSFLSRSIIESLLSKQKKCVRAVMPGYVKYNYKNGALNQGSFTYDVIKI